MDLIETIFTKLIILLYKDSVDLVSCIALNDLLSYTTIAASILSLGFVVGALPISSLPVGQQIRFRIHLNLLKYIPYTAMPLFFTAFILLVASAANPILKHALVNLAFAILIIVLMYLNFIFTRFLIGILFQRLLEAFKVPTGGL